MDERTEVSQAASEFFGVPPHRLAGAVTDAGVFRYIECNRYLHDQLLRDTDVFSMAHSIEVRVPYLDHVLVDRSRGLPKRSEFDGPGSKPVTHGAIG